MELLQIRWVLSLVETVIIIFLFAMPFAALLTYFERKWSALIQDRVGPSRANIGKLKFKGIFHVIADAIKLMFKEDSVTQNTANLKQLHNICGSMDSYYSFMK